jgi:hypothetical protein
VKATPFLDPRFEPPAGPRGDGFFLTPLGVEHNERDLKAWSSSIEHIHSTPGFETYSWPNEPMTLERNHRDLEGHAADFEARRGFTYTVLSDPGDDVIGCVYIYPSRGGAADASVRSWVCAARAELDAPLFRTVSTWLAARWPFERVDYAPR